MSENKVVNKYCLVPDCPNTSMNAPEKLFINVPSDIKIRNVWQKAMRREVFVSNKSHVYCCEDHFKVEEDIENYMYIKTMISGKVRLKPRVVPRFFDCQKNRITTHSSKPRSQFLQTEAQHSTVIETLLLSSKNKTSEENQEEEENEMDIRRMEPISKEIGVQAHIKAYIQKEIDDGGCREEHENLKSRDNLDMGSDLSRREKSKKSTVRSSVRELRIQAELEAHEKLEKIEEEKEKIKLQRLKRMQQKIMLELELKDTSISDESNEEKPNITFDEVDGQFKYNQIQTWIDDGSYENFGNCEKGEEARQTGVDSKEKPNRFKERLSTRQNTPKPEETHKISRKSILGEDNNQAVTQQRSSLFCV
ncbi:hypothetical protein JTB14_010089 [Gonioctena quinquepunctata]|nr:hypothetical protein JTB14_010089 [Gonioctena quinquepunctata]